MTDSEQRCRAHGAPTRLTCAHCETPICPRCMRRTPVGLRCGDCAAPAHRGVRRRRSPAIVASIVVAVGLAAAVVAADPFGDGPASSQPASQAVVTDATSERLQEVVDDIAENAVGGTVAWIDTGREQLGVAAGRADRRTSRPLTGDEAFSLSAVSKLVTATVTLQLVEEGALGLDQPLAEVVPQQAARFEHGDRITVRHLLAYRSGLASYMTDSFNQDLAQRMTVDDGVASAACPPSPRPLAPLEAAAGQPPRFEPGARSGYSRTDDVLLRHVIEAAAGEPLAQVYRERVFEPLGMADTWLRCARSPRAELARGYVGDRGFELLSDPDATILDVTDLDKPLGTHSAALMSTGRDLATFTRALVEGRLFDDDATWQAMRDAKPLAGGPPYGLGLQVTQGIVGHSGGRPGYDALTRHYPARDVVVVVLSTQDPRESRPAAGQIVTALDGSAGS